MLVAQLTDLHLNSDERTGDTNRHRFLSCLQTLGDLIRAPDLYLVTGDIAEAGDEDSYRWFLATMRALGRPWLSLLGNHDCSDRFDAAVGRAPRDGLRHSGSVRVGRWRILCAETAAPGLDGGYFDQPRAEALAALLAEDVAAPTMIAMHHPPVRCGVGWIDPAADADWITRFGATIARFPQVRQIVCGHAHMPVATQFQGVPTCIVPSTAPQLWPEMASFDPQRPDGRLMVIDGQPGFALHRLEAGIVTTTFGAPAAGRVWLRHAAVGARDPAMADS